MDSTSTHVQFQFADRHLFKFMFKCQCEIRPSTAYGHMCLVLQKPKNFSGIPHQRHMLTQFAGHTIFLN